MKMVSNAYKVLAKDSRGHGFKSRTTKQINQQTRKPTYIKKRWNN
jgi:hypothetical protein